MKAVLFARLRCFLFFEMMIFFGSKQRHASLIWPRTGYKHNVMDEEINKYELYSMFELYEALKNVKLYYNRIINLN
jgi:hypothetical protein